jgi:hypothetical protein
MRQAKAQDRSVVIFITGSRIIIFSIRIRADLDPSERDLRSRIHIAITVPTSGLTYSVNFSFCAVPDKAAHDTAIKVQIRNFIFKLLSL